VCKRLFSDERPKRPVALATYSALALGVAVGFLLFRWMAEMRAECRNDLYFEVTRRIGREVVGAASFDIFITYVTKHEAGTPGPPCLDPGQ
jgi:hypothetical protein